MGQTHKLSIQDHLKYDGISPALRNQKMSKVFLEGNRGGEPEEAGRSPPQTHTCQAEKWEAGFESLPTCFFL